MKTLTKKEATQKWEEEFNAINSSLLERAFEDNIDSWIEDGETGDIYRYRWCWI